MAQGVPAYFTDLSSKSPELELLTGISLSEVELPDKESKERVFLQQPIDLAPQLLPIGDFYSEAVSLCSLGMEIPVDVGGGKTGYIDNLFVTNDGHLVLVEAKLHSNREAVRDVIAQVLQYGFAVRGMSVPEFETCLRKSTIADGEPAAATKLKPMETIRDRVEALAGKNKFPGLIDDFDDKLEQYLRRGEMLYLIVTDKIHFSVERMADWLNEKGRSALFMFGLIELQFYKSGEGKSVIVPRILLRTKEIARHVVEVKIDWAAKTAIADVGVQTQTEGGGTLITQSSVKLDGPPMSKDRLLDDVKAKSIKAYPVVSELLHALEPLGLDSMETPTTFQFGLMWPRGAGKFYSLLALSPSGTYSHLPTNLIGAIGDAAFVDHKRALNAVAPFFRPEEVDDPTKKANELVVKYEALAGHVEELVGVLRATNDKAVSSLSRGSKGVG